jgi:hypothetical protein
MHVNTSIEPDRLSAQRSQVQVPFVNGNARLFEQYPENAELGAGQIERASIATNLPGSRVKLQFSDDELSGARPPFCSPENSPDTGDQFARIARLGQIVIGAELQTQNTIQVLRPRRQHDHGNSGVLAKRLKNLYSAHFRHHDIQYHCIDGILTRFSQCFGSIMSLANIETFLTEILSQQLAQLDVIICDQNGF